MPSSIATAKRIATTQTHVVTNQARLWKNFNFYRADPSLQRAMAAYQVDKPQIDTISRFGAQCGEMMDAAERAEKNVPKLKQFDQHGNPAHNHGELSYLNLPLIGEYLVTRPLIIYDCTYVILVGRRIDQVEYHPDYPYLMSHGLRAGCAAYGYNHTDLHSSHVARGMI